MIGRVRSSRGFTLLEVVLALAMSAMLALTLYAAMHVGIRGKRTAVAATEGLRVGVVAVDVVRRDLESVLPPVGILAGPFIGMHQPGIEGDRDSVVFYSIGEDDWAEEGPFVEGIRRIEYSVESDARTTMLVRRVQRNLMPSFEADVEEEIVCRDVRSFSLRYFDGMSWHDNWDSTVFDNALPVAVEVTVQIRTRSDEGADGRRVTRVVTLPCAQPGDFAAMEVGS